MINYLKWLFTEYYFKYWSRILNLLATLFGIFIGFYIPVPVIEEYLYGNIPLLAVIGVFITTYGFLVGMLYYPTRFYPKKRK